MLTPSGTGWSLIAGKVRLPLRSVFHQDRARPSLRLDATDWTLIRELYGWTEGNFPRGTLRVSLPELSKRTGLHAKTLRERLRTLRQGGVLTGPCFELWPHVLGLHQSGHMLEGLRIRDRAALEAALAVVPSVQFAVFAEGFAYVVFWHEAAASPPPELQALAKALGASSHWKSFSSVDFPAPAAASLTDLDGRLVLALRERPDSSLAAVARRVGVTTRTAERRARKLVEAEAGTMKARFHPGHVDGLYVHYVVRTGGPQAAASLVKAFPDRIVGPFGPQFRPNVGVAVANLEEAQRRLAGLEGMPDLGHVGLYLVRDWIYPKRFDAWLAERVATRTSDVRTD